MRRRNKIMMAITALVIAVTSVFYFLSNTKVQAGSSNIDITFEVYKESDYAIWRDFEVNYGVDYDTAVDEVATYDELVDSDGQEAADDFWSGQDAITKSNSLVANRNNYNDGFTDGWWYNKSLMPMSGTFSGTLKYITKSGSTYSLNSKVFSAAGNDIDDLKAGIHEYESVEQTTTFNVGDDVVVLAYSQVDDCYAVSLFFDYTFKNKATSGSDMGKTLIPVSPTPSDTSYLNDNYIDGYFSGENPAKAAGLSGTNYYKTFGGRHSSNEDVTSDRILLGGLSFKIPSGANGDYAIAYYSISNTMYQIDGLTGSSYDATMSGRFVLTEDSKDTITVAGASDDVSLDAVQVGTEADVFQKDTNTVNVAGITDPCDQYILKSTATFKGFPIGSNITIKPTVTGKIVSVKQGKDLTKDISTSDWTTLSGTSGSYTISHDDPGDTTYVAITVDPTSNNTAYRKTYILAIPNIKYDVHQFTGMTLDGPTATGSTVKPVFVGTPTFGTSNATYTIKRYKDTNNSLTFKPLFDATKKMTVKIISVDGTALATATDISNMNNTAVTVNAASSFVIECESQEGNKTTYTFNLTDYKTDNSLTFAENVTNTATKEYTLDKEYDFADTSFTFTPQISNNKTIKIDSTTYTTIPSPLSKNFTPNGNNAITESISIDVTSEAGVTETYTFKVKRKAASTDSQLDVGAFVVKGAKGTGGYSTLTPTGSYDSTNKTWTYDLDYDIQNLKVVPTGLMNGTTKMYYEIYVAGTLVTSGNESQVISVGAISTTAISNQTVTIKVTSEAYANDNTQYTEYKVKYNRAAADDNHSITYKIYGLDKNGNSTGLLFDSTDPSDPNTYGFGETSGTIKNTTALPTSIKGIRVNASMVSTAAEATLKVGSTNINGTNYDKTLDLTQTPSGSFTAVAHNQAGSDANYKFEFYSEHLDNSVKFTTIVATGVDDNSQSVTFNYGGPSYSDDNEMTKGQQNVTKKYSLVVNLEDADKQKAYVSDNQNDFNVISAIPASCNYYANMQLDIDKTYYLCIVAEDEVSKYVYIVDVKFKDERSNDASVDSIDVYATDYQGNEVAITTITGNEYWTFDKTQTAQTDISVPYIYTQVRFDAKLHDANATWTTTHTIENLNKYTSGTSVDQTYTFQSKSEKGLATKSYTIKIKRLAPGLDSYIDSIKVDGVAVTETVGNAYLYAVPDRDKNRVELTITLPAGASFEAATPTVFSASPFNVTGLVPGTYKKVTINVKSEKDLIDGDPASGSYDLYLFSASTQNSVDNIQIKEDVATGPLLKDIDGNIYTYSPTSNYETTHAAITLTIAYASNHPYFDVTHTATPYSVITGDGARNIAKVANNDKVETFDVVSISEYGKLLNDLGFTAKANLQKLTYKYTVTRKKASIDNEFDSLEFIFNNDPTDAHNVTYTKAQLAGMTAIPAFENLGSNASVTINYVKSDITASVVIPGLVGTDAGNKSGTAVKSFTIANDSTYTFDITITAENGTPKTWPLLFAYTNAVLDTTKTLTKITLEGDAQSGDKLGFVYSKSPQTYSIHLSSNNTKAKLTFTLDSSKSKLEISEDGGAFVEYNLSNGIYEYALTANHTHNIVVRCKAQSITTDPTAYKDYSIEIITDPLDSDATLKNILEYRGTSVAQNLAGFTPANGNYTIYVDHTITSYAVEPVLNKTTSKILSNNATITSPLVLNYGENTVLVNVQAEDASVTKLYTIKIYREPELNVSVLNVTDVKDSSILVAYTGDDNYTVTPDLLYSHDKVQVDVEVPADVRDHITVIIDSTISPTKGEGSKEITLTPNVLKTITIRLKGYGTNAEKDYTVKVKRLNGNTAADILTYVDGDNAPTVGTNTIEYRVDHGVATINPVVTVSPGATYVLPTDLTLSVGVNTKKITVTPEVGAAKDYTLTIYRASVSKEIAKIQLFDVNGNEIMENDGTTPKLSFVSTTKTYPISIPYSINNVTIRVTMANGSESAFVYIDGTQDNVKSVVPPVGAKTYVVYALSEYGYYSMKNDSDSKSSEYDITITRADQNKNPKLATLVVKANGTVIPFNETFDPDDVTYTIDNLDAKLTNLGISTSISSVFVEATAQESTTIIDGIGTWSLDSGTDSYIFERTVKGTAEDTSKTKTYTIRIARGAMNLDTDNNINYITFVDSKGNTYIDSKFNWSSANYTTSISIPYNGAQSVTISADKLKLSKSTVYFTRNSSVAHSSQTITSYQDSISTYSNTIPVVYTIYAMAEKAGTENGNNRRGQTYTINVTFLEPSSDASLITLKVDDKVVTGFDANATKTGTEFYYTLDEDKPFNTPSVTITATVSDSKARIVGIGKKTLNLGKNIFTVTVTAETGAQTNYHIEVTRAEEAPYLINLTVEGETLLDANGTAIKYNKLINTYYVKTLNVVKQATIKTTSPSALYSVTCSSATLSDVSANTLIRTFESNELSVGENYFTVTVMSTTDTSKQSEYNIIITRRDEASADTTINSISIKTAGGGLIPAEEFTFDDKISTYELNVDDSVNQLDFTVIPLNNGGLVDQNGESIDAATVEVVGNKDLKAGENNVFVVVTAGDGVTKRLVQVKVNKAPYEFEINSKELTSLKDDYAKNQLKDSYTVDSKTTQFSVTGLNVNSNKDADQPVITLSNDGKLNVGKNEVKLTITAPDGTKTEKTIIVNREKMSFSVDKEAYDYTCSEVSGKDKYYTIDLGEKTATAITDYTKYIKFDTDKNDLQIESLTEITDSTNEVLVKVSTKDGAESDIIHLQLQSTQFTKTGSVFDIIFWIILGIALIILIIILVCVNRDKYGSISKKRKNA